MTAVLQHRYEPRGAAKALLEERRSEVVICGPAGTGKSTVALQKLHLMALKNPGMRGLIVRKTAVSLSSTTLVTFDQSVAPEALAVGAVKWFGGSAREAAGYRYQNGSRIVVGGMDKPAKVMSSEYDVVLVDEATELTLTDWESLISRLRHYRVSFQQIIGACNPNAPTHWLKQRADDGDAVMLDSRHQDNPAYFHPDGTPTDRGRDYLAILGKLTGVRRLRLLGGIWAAAEGVIFEEWDDAVHLVPRRRPPVDWPRFWVVDFGYTNPYVCQRWAEDGDGRLEMYAEQYMSHRLVEDHARDTLLQVTRPVPGVEPRPGDADTALAIQAAVTAGRREWTEPKPQAVICDHDAEDRATLERHLGLSTVPAAKTVKDGLEAVMGRLRPADDGRYRLTIQRDARVELDETLRQAGKPTCTVEEIPGYVWLPAPDGKPTKDQPLKVDDHGCDALRYLVAHRDLLPQPGMRWM